MVVVRGMRLPEFDKNTMITEHKLLVFDGECQYDMILGSDFLSKIGLGVNYDTGMVTWLDYSIPMHTPFESDSEELYEAIEEYLLQMDDDDLGYDWLDAFLTVPILDAKYEKADLAEVARNQTHLSDSQRNDLFQLLSRHERLFDGTLGLYPHEKMHIELLPGERFESFSRPYPVPHIHLDTFKKELDHLVRIGVLSRQSASVCASPTFIAAKKDGRVRWLSDLRALNKVIVRRKYPLPIIMDVLRRRHGYKFFTKLDLSMQYYTFELDEESKDLCTIATPFGLYKLENNGFAVNPLKCTWGIAETDWLAYIHT